jgi:hypothetical protein
MPLLVWRLCPLVTHTSHSQLFALRTVLWGLDTASEEGLLCSVGSVSIVFWSSVWGTPLEVDGELLLTSVRSGLIVTRITSR